MWCSVTFLLFASVEAFLPGVKPQAFIRGSPIEIRAQSLVSSLPGQVPYPFSALPFCRPDVVRQEIASLGEIVFGDLTENTNIVVNTGVNQTCHRLCTVPLDGQDRRFLDELISNRYSIRLLADDLPGLGAHTVIPGSQLKWYSASVPVGQLRNGPTPNTKPHKVINNVMHLTISLTFDDMDTSKFLIHDFSITMSSSNAKTEKAGDMICSEEYGDESPLVLTHTLPSYDVWLVVEFRFIHSVVWTDRWKNWISVQRDGYIATFDESKATPEEKEALTAVIDMLQAAGRRQEASLKSFSIIMSSSVVLLLSTIVGFILYRTLLRDIAAYNSISSSEVAEFVEESGWKLLHGDVFRKPAHFTILSAWVGCGLQLMTVGAVLTLLAALGFVSPYFSRSKLVAYGLAAWALSGYVAGFASSRLYGSFQSAVNWRLTTVRTIVIWPGIMMTIFACTNLILACLSSAAALPFKSLCLLTFMWLGVSTPLSLIGTYHGYRQEPLAQPVKTSKIPRHIVTAEHWSSKMFKWLIGGVTPFAACVAEYIYMVASEYPMRSHMLIGFCVYSGCVLIIACAEVSITMTYITLRQEDYNWWWPAFFSSASTAIYVFVALAVHPLLLVSYALTSLRPVVYLVWLGYSLMASYTMFVFCGAIGFVASFLFVRAIYGSIKVD